MATASLVLGIISLVCCGYLAAIPAIICGFLALDSIKKGSLSSAHRGKALAGIICGIASVILWTVLLATGTLQNLADRGDKMPPNNSQLPVSPSALPPTPPRQDIKVTTKPIPYQARVLEHPPSDESLPSEPAPEPAKPLGSEQVLQQVLESHVRALAASAKESTALRKEMLTEESVTRTQKRLDVYVFAITALVKNVEYIDFDNSARVYIESQAGLAAGGDEEGLYFPINSVDIKISKAEAANIKRGSRLVIQGRILVSPYKGGGLPALQFCYKKADFAITEYTCRIIY